MSNLTDSDSAYLRLQDSVKALKVPSKVKRTNTKQVSEIELQNVFDGVKQFLDINSEYNDLDKQKVDTIKNIEVSKNGLKLVSRELFSEIQREVNQFHEPMNEYFQLITGNSDKEIFLRVDLDEKTDEGQIHLLTNFAPGLEKAQPSGYFSNAEKHAFVFSIPTSIHKNI